MSSAWAPTGQRRLRAHLGRSAAVLVLAGALLVGWASIASAHVSLVSSEPLNVSTVAGPLDEVRLTYSAEADAVTDEFRVVTTDGTSLAIDSVTNDGSDTLVVRLAEPAPAGRTRLTWAIRSGDSHTMTGSLSFTVTEPAVGATPDAAVPPAAGPDDEPSARAGASDAAGSTPARMPADHLATATRWLVYAAAFTCIGGLAYLAFVHRGTPEECRRLVFYVRRAALVVVVASAVEWLAQVVAYSRGTLTTVLSPSAWGDLLGTGFAAGTALRLVGAALVLGFTRIEVDHWQAATSGSGTFDRHDPFRDGHDDGSTAVGRSRVAVGESDVSLARSRVEASTAAFLGAALLVISEAFIGHTATVSPRVVVLLSDAGHMVAAAAWSSGAMMLALTLRARRRAGRPLDARLLAVRFSVLATWALVVVATTGVVLGWSIMGGPSGLWASEFGRILALKLVVVAGLVAAGGYNHLVLVPGLEAGDPAVDQRFARVIAIEAVLFAAVLAFTALLVVSSPT